MTLEIDQSFVRVDCQGVPAAFPNTVHEREESLLCELRFIDPAFGNLSGLARDYIRAFPPLGKIDLPTDADRLLKWLETHFALSDRQRDYISCLRARRAIQTQRGKQLSAHRRFVSMTDSAVDPADRRARIHLNPIRIWNRLLTTEFLDAGATPPCNVLFFATPTDVSLAMFELESQVLLNELADFQPCTIEFWAAHSFADRSQLSRFCNDLVAMGLAAVSTD